MWKMQSKYPYSYTSFKAAVEKSDFEKLKSPDVWPKRVGVDNFLSQKKEQWTIIGLGTYV